MKKTAVSTCYVIYDIEGIGISYIHSLYIYGYYSVISVESEQLFSNSLLFVTEACLVTSLIMFKNFSLLNVL